MPGLALFDMDGTLFNHDAILRADLIRIAGPDDEPSIEEITCENLRDLATKYPWIDARIDIIRRQPGWWRSLPRYEPGWEILRVVREIGFCTQILTKGPSSKPVAWMEKVQCIHDHFGDDMSIDIMGKDKGGRYGRVLVDDWGPYLLSWLEHRPRGLGIMPAWDYNADFKHPNVIRYDGSNMELLRAALRAAYDRGANEHWHDLMPFGDLADWRP